MWWKTCIIQHLCDSHSLTILLPTLPVNPGLPYGILVLEQVQYNRSGYLLTFRAIQVLTLHIEIEEMSSKSTRDQIRLLVSR